MREEQNNNVTEKKRKQVRKSKREKEVWNKVGL